MKTTKEMIEVMQAYLDGKQIEESTDQKAWFTCEPIWNWAKCDYRVRKKVYVPFDTAEEFLTAQKEHGGDGLISTDNGTLKKHDISVSLDGSVYEHGENQWTSTCEYVGHIKDLLEDYKFADGTPCGKEV